MAVVARRQPSPFVPTGLSVATVALNVAGAAADAIPIAKQILNSAAHICAAAERIQKKREAMYTLVEKAEIYATQIDIAVAGRILDPSLQRRLERLYSVFVKVETLVDHKVRAKRHAVAERMWQNIVTKPNRAESLVAELDREIQLFQLLTGIELRVRVDDAARAVAADAKYDGQFRILRDCDIEKLDIIHKRVTDEGVVVWASARVECQIMVIRYLESQPTTKRDTKTTSKGFPYHEYLENVKTVSTIRGSHPHIVQLFGCHGQGSAAVFRSGTFLLWDYLKNLLPKPGDDGNAAVRRLRLFYKILDASYHLTHVHSLIWMPGEAIVDENGEPCIGLFDDILRVRPDLGPPSGQFIYFKIFHWHNSLFSAEIGVVEHVHQSSLATILTEHLPNRNVTDRLQRLWDIIRHEQLYVKYYSHTFPIISGDLSLSPELIARARVFFETSTEQVDNPLWIGVTFFERHILAGKDANISPSQISIYIWGKAGDDFCEIQVQTCAHADSQMQYDEFWISIPTGCALMAEVARVVGLPDDFPDTWQGHSNVNVYSREGGGRRNLDTTYENKSGTTEGSGGGCCEYAVNEGEDLEEKYTDGDVGEDNDLREGDEDYETVEEREGQDDAEGGREGGGMLQRVSE